MWLKNEITSLVEKDIDRESIYVFSFIAVVFLGYLETTTFTEFVPRHLIDQLTYVVLLFPLFKLFFLDNYKISKKIVIISILLLSIISWKKAGSNVLFVMTVMILSAQGVSFNKLIKYYFYITLILFIATIFYSLLGIIQNLVYQRGNVYRYSFGINYPTDFAAHIFSLCLAYCYLHFNKLKFSSYIFFFLLAFVVNFISNARLSMITVLLIIPVMLVAQAAERKNRICRIIASFYWTSIPILGFIVGYAAYFYTPSNHLYMHFNNLLSGRLQYSKIGFDQYGFSWFGNRVIEHGWGSVNGHYMMGHAADQYFYLDSSYIRLMILFGLLMGIWILGVAVTISLTEIKHRHYALPAVIFLLSISSLIDQHFLELAYNPFLIALLASRNVIGEDNIKYE